MGRKAQVFRSKNDDELARELSNRHEELYKLRFQSASEQLVNPKLMRELRKDIARILTVLQERAREGSQA